jgi:hypothetical protein
LCSIAAAIIFSGVYQGPLALALSTTVTIVAYAYLRVDNWLIKSFTFMLAASGFLLTSPIFEINLPFINNL